MMTRWTMTLLMVVGMATSAAAQDVRCDVRGVGTPYADGDARLTVRCDTNGGVSIPRGTVFTITVAPPKQDCVGSWGEWVIGEWGACVDGQQSRTNTRVFRVTQPAQNGGAACAAADGQIETQVETQGCVVTPPPGGQIWGVWDPSTLGTCSQAVHDKYVVDGGDGWLYRTWHPQRDPSGCTFGHEHGDDPARMTNAEIAAVPVRFGYIGRRMNHEEPHEGFKVFIALPGDRNDEGRVNRVFSRSVFHMGTGGPKRFTTQHHSAEIRLIHPEFGLKAFTQLMMDTGGANGVCDPRAQAPTKDGLLLGGCKRDSTYEIWSTIQRVKDAAGVVRYQAFATPAVFDPITAFDPANPTDLIYVWDPRVDSLLNFPGNDRSYYRGCDRESYAQPGYWYNAGGQTQYYTDAMGNPLDAANPAALVQEISRSNSISAPATLDGLNQFKMRVNYCGNRSALGLKN